MSRLMGLVSLAPPASPELAAESSVMIAGHIPATLSLPDRSSGKVPAVLLLHGFASQKDEVGDMYKNLARKPADLGVASLRIDVQGSGASPVPFEQMTFTTQVSDAQAAFDYLKGLGRVDASRLGVLGFSMGGGVAIKLAAHPANPVKSLALWSSTSSRSLANIAAQSRGQAEKAGRRRARSRLPPALRKSRWKRPSTPASRIWKATSGRSGGMP